MSRMPAGITTAFRPMLSAGWSVKPVAQYPATMPSPVTSSRPPHRAGRAGAAERRTASGRAAASRALIRPTNQASRGQPIRQTATVDADSAPSSGYHRRLGRPVRVITWLRTTYSPRPSSAPRSAATTVSAALTRWVPRMLRPSRRSDARRRFRLAAESRAQTERKMPRGRRTSEPSANRR
ncbi:hypothetical protein ACWDRX_03485 [Streptomyces nigra]